MAKADVIKEFTKIKGVGKAKAELLYSKGYNSLDKLKKATAKDLVNIDGITETIAKDIKNHFKDTPKPKTPVKPKDTKKVEIKDKPKKKEEKPKDKQEPKPEPEKEVKESKPTEKEEEETPKEEEEGYKVKKKPELSKKQIDKLRLRKHIKNRTPEFLREEWFRYKKIPKNWRKPDGISSKMRRNYKYRPSMVRVGFRGPKETRGLHPSGFEEVTVYNVNDLENVDPKIQAARIGSTVGTKKRIDIEKKAEELEIRILNM